MLKALNDKSGLSFQASKEKMVEFTDSTLTIYWPRNIAKKVANCLKKPFYVSTKNLPI